ncbi:uncharacterized protein J3D65DRAFT_616976 [Phyllosticta citribraziliensis]|uniref:Uncharacterized protein n=1 Tax=Phyllosticta citribraziliensis TaxID=989973 RepID=A0ABR1M0G9_9PEZI
MVDMGKVRNVDRTYACLAGTQGKIGVLENHRVRRISRATVVVQAKSCHYRGAPFKVGEHEAISNKSHALRIFASLGKRRATRGTTCKWRSNGKCRVQSVEECLDQTSMKKEKRLVSHGARARRRRGFWDFFPPFRHCLAVLFQARNPNPSKLYSTSQSKCRRVRNRGLQSETQNGSEPFSKAETRRWRNRPAIWPDAPACRGGGEISCLDLVRQPQ